MSSLLRSTKFVRYFTGAARTLILNSAKTTEANLLANTKALCSNSVVVRDYATAKKTESLEPLLQKLDNEVRRFGRITKRDIDEVFDELRAKHDITSSQSLLVIRCCGELVPEELPEQRTLLVQKIWGILTERGIPMDISHYNALLRVYLENEHPFSPAKFLEELEKKGLQPNRVTYQRLMWRYCQEGDVEGATKVLEKMRELNMPVSEPVLNALVMGHAFHGDTDGAKAVLETMAAAGLQPTNRTYTLLACGYAKQGDIEQIENIIKTASEKDSFLVDKDILDIIEHLALNGHGDKVEKLFPHLQKSIGYNQEVCNLILRLLNKDQIEVAKKIMKTMPKSQGAEDTPFKGAFFIKQLIKTNKTPETIINTCRELQSENLIPNAILLATEFSLVNGQAELAQELFKEIKKDGKELRTHYYWPLLAQKGKEGDEEALLQILRNMGAEGLPINGETLRDYVLPYLMKKATPQNVLLKLQLADVPFIHAARNLMVELLGSGDIKEAANLALQYRPRGQYSLVSRPLTNALASTKDIDSFVTILHVISSHENQSQMQEESVEEVDNDKIDSQAIGRLVLIGIKNIPNDLREKLLTAVHAKGLRISTESAEQIEQYLGENMTTKLSELLLQLSSTNLTPVPLSNVSQKALPRTSNQWEKILEKAKSKSGNYNGVQRQLLMAYINENKMDKVVSYVNELKDSGFEITAATLAQLFEFYCLNDEVEKAMEVKAEIASKHPSFSLNPYKLVLMANALVKMDRYEEAVQFLIDNKPVVVHESAGFMYNSKCWQMLNFLAEKKDTEKVIEMTKTLIENNYIEASNVLLGPSIKVHLLNNDLEGALKTFEHCCTKYRSTPWKGELMKELILKEDATKLQWLADISTQIHGEVNILHDLVLAFVECGRLRQARRILETPGMHTRQKRLQDACERYVEEGKPEHLEGLLEATKELSHIDRSKIFYLLLVSYCKADETDKALGLWTLLQEEGEVPSDQFLLKLGNHLKSKNRNVPFAMPMEAKLQVKEKKAAPTKAEETISNEVIENLAKEGKAAEATDLAIKKISSGQSVKTSILKFVLKQLAAEGNVDKINEVNKYLNEDMRRSVSYDDKLTLAEFIRGNGANHINKLMSLVENAKNDEELEIALRRFPKSLALSMGIENPDIISKCHKVAEVAASKGKPIPANLLWMEYILQGKQQEADQLYKQCLTNVQILLFRRLLQESHTRNEPKLIEDLIELLQTNKQISLGSLGNAYSRLINLYLTNQNNDKAKETFERALKQDITPSQLNKTTLKRLKDALGPAGEDIVLE